MSAGPLALLLGVLAVAAAAGAAVLSALQGFRGRPPGTGASDAAAADARVALALPSGLILYALPGWLASAAWEAPFATVVAPFGVAAWAAALLLGRHGLGRLLSRGRSLLLPAAVPLAGFLLFLFLRWPDGAIRGTEKPMDLAVLSAALEARSLPLPDPWLAGERLSSYHFGTYAFAQPFRLAGVAPGVAYNLLAAGLAGLTAGAAFAAVRLRGGGRRLAAGAAAALLLAGTLDGARQLLAGTHLSGIDFWASSRRVAGAITEWPLFTLRLGDLHPHAVALPLLVAWAGLAARPGTALLQGVLLGSLLAANPWALPAAGLVLAAGTLAREDLHGALLDAVLASACAVPVLLPFLLGPRPPFLALAASPAATTSPEAFLHLGGLLAVPALALGVALVRSRPEPATAFLVANVPPAAGIALATLTGRPVLGLALGFVLGAVLLGRRPRGAIAAGFALAGAGCVLAAIPEVVVVEPYGQALRRTNTVFQTWAGAAPLLVLASALLLQVVLATRRARKTVRVLLAASLAGVLVHPAAAVAVRLAAGPGSLDGLASLDAEAPGDRAAIEWLRANAPAGAVVAEAPGSSYTAHGRIAAGSGRPCLLGWASHQVVWRGEKVRPELEKRRADLLTLYGSRDAGAVRRLLSERRVAFVVVGRLERAAYGIDAFPARSAFEAVFSEKGTAVYRVPAP